MRKKLIEDTNQKKHKHDNVKRYCESHEIEIAQYRLPVGDYIASNEKIEDLIRRKQARGIKPQKADFLGLYNIVIEDKSSLEELCGNLTSNREKHLAFRDECILAQQNNIRLIVLIEEDQTDANGRYVVNNLYDVHKWKNPRLKTNPKATTGMTLKKTMITMMYRYGCEFRFCRKKDAGKVICELLGIEMEGDENE